MGPGKCYMGSGRWYKEVVYGPGEVVDGTEDVVYGSGGDLWARGSGI